MHNPRFGKAVGTAMLSVLLLFAAVAPSHADERERCHRRIERAEARLDEAIRRHGKNSHQAYDRRRDLNAERERCWREHHAWWDAHEHQWHNDRDWDRDHDYH
jgi:hypothetical protein